MILAHIRQDGAEQSLREHCTQAAVYAQKALKGTGLEKTAYLAGLLHDMGKANVVIGRDRTVLASCSPTGM